MDLRVRLDGNSRDVRSHEHYACEQTSHEGKRSDLYWALPKSF
jgi:hypothetical protein